MSLKKTILLLKCAVVADVSPVLVPVAVNYRFTVSIFSYLLILDFAGKLTKLIIIGLIIFLVITAVVVPCVLLIGDDDEPPITSSTPSSEALGKKPNQS